MRRFESRLIVFPMAMILALVSPQPCAAQQEPPKKEAPKKKVATANKNAATAKKEAASFREQALNFAAAAPAEHGPERVKNLREAVGLFEKANAAVEAVNENDDPETLRVYIPSDLGWTLKRLVRDEDGVNELLAAVEAENEARKKLTAAEAELKKNQPSPDAKAAFAKASETLALATREIEIVAKQADAAAKNFRVAEERIRKSSKMGPKHPFLLNNLGMHYELLEAEITARRRMLALFSERHPDPAKLSETDKAARGLLEAALAKKEAELKKVDEQLANFSAQ